MKANPKSLSVPYIPELDNAELETVGKILDEKGNKNPIDILNWKEQFPYHPLTSFSIAHSGTHIYVEFLCVAITCVP